LKRSFPTSGCTVSLRKSTESDVIYKVSSPAPSMLLAELLPGCLTNNFTFVFFLLLLLLLVMLGHPSLVHTEPSQVLCRCFCNFGHSIASSAIKQLFFLFVFATVLSFLPLCNSEKK
jgi:hypothetical protein